MRYLSLTVVGTAPYSSSRCFAYPGGPFEKGDKESHDDYDARTWREKAHYDKASREVFIPPTGFKWAIAEAAKRLAIKVPGKRGQTYGKNVLSGTICADPVFLGVKVDELEHDTVYVNADGIRGSGKRVWRRFPIIPAGWKGKLNVVVTDDEIPAEVLELCIREAGSFIGVGRFRPERGGYLGRFEASNFKWKQA